MTFLLNTYPDIFPERRHPLQVRWTVYPRACGEPNGLTIESRMGQVYPRACGGTSPAYSAFRPSSGLSPRLRGNRPESEGAAQDRRSIPAPAGEPTVFVGVAGQLTVYPRACGGTLRVPAAAAAWTGLSPRLRGNLEHLGYRPYRHGSIPAPAGEPTPGSRGRPHYPVYPRACGGTLNDLAEGESYIGLSPRLRGNLSGAARRCHRHRSIPAPAGEPH